MLNCDKNEIQMDTMKQKKCGSTTTLKETTKQLSI